MLRPVECFVGGSAWTHENRVTSDGETQDVCLTGLSPDALELIGELIKVDGQTKLNGVFKQPPFQTNGKVTTDGFDQTTLYHTLGSVAQHIIDLGFDLPGVIKRKRGEDFKIVGHANAMADLNAWYAPQEGELSFGTANGKWHLASDGDISAHEEGHLILDHFNPSLGGWGADESAAIHEGFGDIIAGGHFNDAEMSEDFVSFEGRPENKKDGLRIISNDLSLDDVSREEHDRGQVYAGFFWAIKRALESANGPFQLSSSEAADTMLKIAMNHTTNYTTMRPTPKDFVNAVVLGIKALAKEGKLPTNPDALLRFVIEEAGRRKMITSPADITPPRVEFRSVEEYERALQALGTTSVFKQTHVAKFEGGFFEIYSQFIPTPDLGLVEATGRGLIIIRNNRGEITSFSTRDVLMVKPTQVETGGSVNLRQAVDFAVRHAQNKFHLVTQKLRNFRPERSRTSIKEFRSLQAELEIVKNDLRTLSQIQNTIMRGGNLKPKITLIDGSLVPNYEFKVGLSIYYVDKNTGAVTWRRDVKMD